MNLTAKLLDHPRETPAPAAADSPATAASTAPVAAGPRPPEPPETATQASARPAVQAQTDQNTQNVNMLPDNQVKHAESIAKPVLKPDPGVNAYGYIDGPHRKNADPRRRGGRPNGAMNRPKPGEAPVEQTKHRPLTMTDLAAKLGVGRDTVYRWRKAGCPVQGSIEEIEAWANDNAGDTAEITQAKLAVLKQQARKLKSQNDERDKLLVNFGAVEALLARTLGILFARLDQRADQLPAVLHGAEAAKIKEVLSADNEALKLELRTIAAAITAAMPPAPEK